MIAPQWPCRTFRCHPVPKVMSSRARFSSRSVGATLKINAILNSGGHKNIGLRRDSQPQLLQCGYCAGGGQCR